MTDPKQADTKQADLKQAARGRVIELILDASDEDVSPEAVEPTTSLRDELDLTSMQAITLVMDLEDEFDVAVEDQEIERLETVGDVFTLLDQKLDAKLDDERSGGD
jgi:acyl carrier protein